MKPLLDSLKEGVSQSFDDCIGCDTCMKVCPVVEDDVFIKDLNEATKDGSPLPANIEKFANECNQCGKCSTFCPAGVPRADMMLLLKAKVTKKRKTAKTYKLFFKTRGPDRSIVSSAKEKIKLRLSRDGLGEVARYIDKDDFQIKPYLFYFGCAALDRSAVCNKTLRIASYLNLEYEVLAGKTVCSGFPQYLAGDLKTAEKYQKYLYEQILRVRPEYVVTGCAECLMSLTMIKKRFKAAFLPMSTAQWLDQHQDKLGLKKTAREVTFHDACFSAREQGIIDLPRKVVSKVAKVIEMPDTKLGGACCGFHNHNANPKKNENLRALKMERVKQTGTNTMVVGCSRCLSSFKKPGEKNHVEVLDIVELVYDNIKDKIEEQEKIVQRKAENEKAMELAAKQKLKEKKVGRQKPPEHEKVNPEPVAITPAEKEKPKKKFFSFLFKKRKKPERPKEVEKEKPEPKQEEGHFEDLKREINKLEEKTRKAKKITGLQEI